ncbi:MAG: hypothetical protein IJN83_05145 [Clostridia bacterium]|nr:hypothetical protein [Clostridia bacterium]
MKRKLFSLAMIVCLVLTLIPAAAFAADTIAKIGDDVYDKLQKAIDAAQDGDVIFLLEATTESSITIKDGTMIYLGHNLKSNNDLLMKLITAAGEKVYSIVTHENNTIFAYGTKGIENAAKHFDEYTSQKHTIINIVNVTKETTLNLPAETDVYVANDNIDIDICATIESRNGSVCLFSEEKIEETAKQLAEENPDEDIKVTVVKAEADTELTLPEGVEVKVQYGAIENSGSGSVIINGAPVGSGGSHIVPVAPPSNVTSAKPRDSIKVTYNGGNSFSTSKSAVPTSVEIDGVAVGFSGDGKLFTVNSIPAGAKWVTVRWNSTSVTTNFTPNGAYFAEVEIPKTGDMPIWAAIAAVFGF